MKFTPSINRPVRDLRFKVARKLSHFVLHHYHKGVGARWLLNKICHWLIPQVDKSICPTIYDVNLLIDDFSDHIERSIYYLGTYEAGTISVLKKFLHLGDVFLDVGAHIGLFSCIVARLVGDSGIVYAVEPNAEAYDKLRENIRVNKLQNVCALNVALGAEEGEARIFSDKDKSTASLICPENIRLGKQDQIHVTTVDKLIENGTICVPTFMKVDVEGFELEVLKGARNLLSSSKAPMLCVEYEQQRGNTYEIYKFLESMNDYSFYKLKYGKEIPSKLVRISGEPRPQNYDNIFCFLVKHMKNEKVG